MTDKTPFRTFLNDVRLRAVDALIDRGLACEGDPADVHEDVRGALWSFFEEIRELVEGPLCPTSVQIGKNAYAQCDLIKGHDGSHHPCVGAEVTA